MGIGVDVKGAHHLVMVINYECGVRPVLGDLTTAILQIIEVTPVPGVVPTHVVGIELRNLNCRQLVRVI